jgi:ABC-type thiamine transport system ATPase subunit
VRSLLDLGALRLDGAMSLVGRASHRIPFLSACLQEENIFSFYSRAQNRALCISPNILDTDFGAREVENLLRSLAYGQFV